MPRVPLFALPNPTARQPPRPPHEYQPQRFCLPCFQPAPHAPPHTCSAACGRPCAFCCCALHADAAHCMPTPTHDPSPLFFPACVCRHPARGMLQPSEMPLSRTCNCFLSGQQQRAAKLTHWGFGLQGASIASCRHRAPFGCKCSGCRMFAAAAPSHAGPCTRPGFSQSAARSSRWSSKSASWAARPCSSSCRHVGRQAGGCRRNRMPGSPPTHWRSTREGPESACSGALAAQVPHLHQLRRDALGGALEAAGGRPHPAPAILAVQLQRGRVALRAAAARLPLPPQRGLQRHAVHLAGEGGAGGARDWVN